MVYFKKRCPSFKMDGRLLVSNWGRTHSLQIKLPLREKKKKKKDPSQSDQKWRTTTRSVVPSQVAWSLLRFQLYCVVLLCLSLPYSDSYLYPAGFLLTDFTFILRAFATVTILFLQTSVLRAPGRTLHPSLFAISRRVASLGAFQLLFHSNEATVCLSVGLIRSSPGRLRSLTCPLFLAWAVLIPTAAV